MAGPLGAALLGYGARFGMRALGFVAKHGGVTASAGRGSAAARVNVGGVSGSARVGRGGYRYRVGVNADPAALLQHGAMVYNKVSGRRSSSSSGGAHRRNRKRSQK